MISVPGTSGFLVVLAASVTAACSSTSPPEPKPLAPADLAAMPYFDAVEWLETWLVEAEVAGGRVEGYESFDFAAPAEVRPRAGITARA